jgi:phospholipase/carboxylesterase
VFAGADMKNAPMVVVAVHGRSLDPADMITNAVERLDRGDLSYVLPAAEGGTWYPNSFLSPLEDNQPRLDFALERMRDARELINAAGVEDDRILWLGFSQGACLVTEYVARSNTRFAGLICFTGGLIGPSFESLTRPREVTNMPVFVTVSDHDEWIPLGRAEETSRIFQQAGADLEFVITADTAHEIVDDASDEARDLLDELSPPNA